MSREVRALRRAALLHDIGKLGVGNSILDKAGPLTPAERTEMELHTQHTFGILRDVPRFARFAMLAASHHERLDGSGYHLGLDGEALSLPARILAAADVCEALSARRPYREAMPLDQVVAELKRAVGARRLCGVAVDALTGWFDGLPNQPVHLTSGGDSTSLFAI
jgi:HD-GYP domain-containing protein (c-di-GMP phosphodiesterase class II)